MLNIKDLVKPTQKELFKYLKQEFKKATTKDGKYIYLKGEAPILLVAHLDTVHQEIVKQICISEDGNILMSPQGIGGDDRCGVYALLKIWETCKIKPHLLFTCDEEIGGVGARAFAKDYDKNKSLQVDLQNIKCMVEIDRKGNNDAVYYECGNKEFEAYITSKGFKTEIGTYSDIVDLSPVLQVASVNLSSGYYNQHTLHEYINIQELENVIERVIDIVNDTVYEDFPKYEFVEVLYTNKFNHYKSYNSYNDWYGNGISTDDLWDGYEDLYEIEVDKLLEAVPLELQDMCEDLLQYYLPEELQADIEDYGVEFIRELYKELFGEIKKERK